MIGKTNPTIAALDRAAQRIGINLVRVGENKREFIYRPTNRTMRYQPGGKGIVRVESYLGDILMATATRTVEAMEQLFIRSKTG